MTDSESKPDPEKMFALSLEGDGISISQKIDQRRALLVVQAVLGSGGPTIIQSAQPSDSRLAPGASMSLREYLDKIGATKKPDQITTIANYISEVEGHADFVREDIRSRFLAAREPLPANFGRDFGVAIRSGWLAEVHGKKNRFYVTAKGIQAINANFSNGKSAASRR